MATYSYIIFAVASVLLCAGYVLLRRFIATAKFHKATALLCILFYIGAYYLVRPAMASVIRLGGENSPFGEQKLLCAAVLIFTWLSAALMLLAVMHRFTAFRAVENILKWVGAPVALLNGVMLKWNVLGIVGENTNALAHIQSVSYALYCALFLFLCLLSWVDNPACKWQTKGFFAAFGWLAAAVAVSFQSYSFIALFGPAKEYIKVHDLTPFHRMTLYGGFLFLIAVFVLLRKMDRKVIHHALLYLSFSTLIIFLSDYTGDVFMGATFFPLRLPLHLCHTAMFLVPLCLMFDMKRLYNFTFFINVIGAFLAMAMPNYAEGLNFFAPSLVVFWVNHICAFGMPLLLMALGEFERPKLKQFYYSMVAFTVYFFCILFINAWFSNYGSVDFFFLNSDFVVNKLGKWAEDTRLITVSFEINYLKFTFYPLYQALFFVCYVIFTVCMWFLYEQCFTIADLYGDIIKRSQKIKADRLALESQLDGRSMEEPLYMQETELLVLDHVSKRYGSSHVFAVKDANLTVHGGEIFGFLGPNGAGKSTIIKSIVGIQPITEGQIRVCGYDAMRQPVEAKRQLGFVPDHYELYENLSGREYINYIADLYRVSSVERTERIDRYVSLFHLEGAFDNPMKTYSHGMKQKIAIMAALVHNPKVWILDEPLTGLDPDSIFQVKECMKQHAKEGNIVFFSSHIIDVVERICDRIAIIRKGEILTCRTLKEIEESGVGLENFYMQTIGAPVQKSATAEEQTV
ncbi:MAG: YwaF family protein [Clostridia bacterium]|nr:YwaF family protein [Clostridia bacterium]